AFLIAPPARHHCLSHLLDSLRTSEYAGTRPIDRPRGLWGASMKRGLFLGMAGMALGLMAATGVQAQFGGLGRIVNSVVREVPIPDFLSGPQPVSTNIRDAIYADPSRDGFAPGPGRPLTDLPR